MRYTEKIKWYVQISLAEYDSPSDIAFDYLETVKPVTNDSLDTIYFTSRKVIHITDRVDLPYSNGSNVLGRDFGHPQHLKKYAKQ